MNIVNKHSLNGKKSKNYGFIGRKFKNASSCTKINKISLQNTKLYCDKIKNIINLNRPTMTSFFTELIKNNNDFLNYSDFIKNTKSLAKNKKIFLIKTKKYKYDKDEYHTEKTVIISIGTVINTNLRYCFIIKNENNIKEFKLNLINTFTYLDNLYSKNDIKNVNDNEKKNCIKEHHDIVPKKILKKSKLMIDDDNDEEMTQIFSEISNQESKQINDMNLNKCEKSTYIFALSITNRQEPNKNINNTIPDDFNKLNAIENSEDIIKQSEICSNIGFIQERNCDDKCDKNNSILVGKQFTFSLSSCDVKQEKTFNEYVQNNQSDKFDFVKNEPFDYKPDSKNENYNENENTQKLISSIKNDCDSYIYYFDTLCSEIKEIKKIYSSYYLYRNGCIMAQNTLNELLNNLILINKANNDSDNSKRIEPSDSDIESYEKTKNDSIKSLKQNINLIKYYKEEILFKVYKIENIINHISENFSNNVLKWDNDLQQELSNISFQYELTKKNIMLQFEADSILAMNNIEEDIQNKFRNILNNVSNIFEEI